MAPPNRVAQIPDNLRALFSDADPDQLYESFQSVGSGNFGTVFYAQEKSTKQVVAIKKIHYNSDDRNKKEETWRMVVKEITVMHKCNHPNLVSYYTCFLRAPDVYIVMEYCLGSTADILNVNESSLHEQEIAVICNQTLQALVYLHDHDCIHRDVKACNILLSSDGKVKLGDFGTVSLTDKAASFIGTPYWMAPEVIKSEDEIMYTQTIDVWSLGICCFEFTTGYPPYHAMHVMAALYHIPNNKPDLKHFIENYSNDFVNFVSKCFLDFEDRPTSKTLLLEDPFITTERAPNLLPNLLERTVRKVEHAQRVAQANNTGTGKLKQFGKQKLLLPQPVLSNNSSSSHIEHPNGSPGSDSNGGSWTPEESVSDNRQSVSMDCTDEPVYRNLLPGAASANGGYENLDSVNATATKSNNTTTAPNNNNATATPRSSINNDHVNNNSNVGIYQNTTTNNTSTRMNSAAAKNSNHSLLTPEAKQEPLKTIASSLVAGNSNIISLSPNRMEHHSGMSHSGPFSSNGQPSVLSKIATIKTQNFKQQEEKSKLEMREQMSGYKEMRREHQKQIQALEAKCKASEEQCTKNIQQEYESEKTRAGKEEAKAKQADALRLQQKDREIEKRLNKFQSQLKEQQAGERKKFEAFQKKYRKAKEQEIKEQYATQRDMQLLELSNLETEQTKSREEADRIWASQLTERLLALKEQLLSEKLELENEILNGEMQRRSVELDLTNRMIIRHHEQWAHLQKENQQAIQDLRYKLMSHQHEIELQNHRRYHQTTMKELDKRHQDETRNQPKLIRDKEKQIQNQLSSALDTQNKQYKQLAQLRIEEAPRDTHKDVARKLQQEQDAKTDALRSQYRESIERMKESNETNLKRQHQQEAEEVANRLKSELETLENYQKQVKYQTEQQRIKEKQDLEKEIEQRFKKLQKKIDEDKKKFVDEKKKREMEKREEHGKKMNEFRQEYEKLMFHFTRIDLVHTHSSSHQLNISSQDIPGGGNYYHHGNTISYHQQSSGSNPETPPSSNRQSKILNGSELDSSQTPPPPIPRTTSIKQSKDSVGSPLPNAASSTLLQISQRSSVSSNSSFHEQQFSRTDSHSCSSSSTPSMIHNSSSNISNSSAAAVSSSGTPNANLVTRNSSNVSTNSITYNNQDNNTNQQQHLDSKFSSSSLVFHSGDNNNSASNNNNYPPPSAAAATPTSSHCSGTRL